MKKIWEKPKLIVLYKGKPEDFVLAGCKNTAEPTAGAANYFGVCNQWTGRAVAPCSAISAS